MNNKWFTSMELWFAMGLLALNLSFVVERYFPISDFSKFLQGLLLGLSIAANIIAIILLPSRLKPR
jgi:hypothetical protein